MNPGAGKPATFVGRHGEMADLTAAMTAAMSGHGQIVMLAGEPGIGMTRIAQELASWANDQGVQTLWGWCYEQEGATPYWPWVQPIRSYVQNTDAQALDAQMGPGAADICEIIPQVRDELPCLEPASPLEPAQSRFRLFDSITTSLKGWGPFPANIVGAGRPAMGRPTFAAAAAAAAGIPGKPSL